jgi:hypothetical protein
VNPIALVSVVLLQTATPSIETIMPARSVYRVVLVDGTEYTARERYVVRGKLAVFTLIPSQVVVSIPLDTINEQATRAANYKTPIPPTPSITPTPLKATPRWTKAPRIILVGTPQPFEAPPRPVILTFPGYLRFAGRGNDVTKLFPLDQDLYVFRLKYTGESNFIVKLLNEAGQRIDTLSNEIGDFSGSKAVRIEREGKYLINVQATGEWSITVEWPN